MKHRRILPLILVLAIVSQGCALFPAGGSSEVTPLQQVYRLKSIYTVTVLAVKGLYAAGKMSDEQYRDFDKWEKVAWDAIERAEAKAVAGENIDFAFVLDEANKAIDAMMLKRIESEGSANPAAHLPAPRTEQETWTL